MRKLKWLYSVAITFFLFFAGNTILLNAQSMPEELQSGTLDEQYEYLQQRTNIYNNFRAIREDMFRQIRRNSIDSLNTAYAEIRVLDNQLADSEAAIDSLDQQLEEAVSLRDQAVRERDSLSLLGIMVNKTFYNVLLWSIILGLAFLTVLVFLFAKRARSVLLQRETELTELKNEYEDYRKTSRERFEKQAIDHFNEVKRLKGL